MEIKYIVQYHPMVIRDDIPKLDATHRKRVKKAIEQKLMTRPDLFGIPLRQSLIGHRKLRVGDYRVVFRLEGVVVKILVIQHRSIIYKHLPQRN